MKQPWNLFCQKGPPLLYPIFHSSKDPDIRVNAVGWRSVHGWQREKTANSDIWHINSQLLFAKGKELTLTTSANLSVEYKTDYLGQTAHLEHSCMVRNIKTRVYCGDILKSQEHLRMNGSVSGRCTSVPWPTHLSYGKNKVLLQPPPPWITSPSRCEHKLNILNNGWLINPPPLLYARGTTQAKPTQMLQSHFCQLAPHWQAQLFLVYHTPATPWGCRQALFSPHK